MGALLRLIDFAGPRLPTLAWRETVTAGGVIDDESHLRDFNLTYTEALGRTLDERDSLNLINQCAKEMT